MMFARFEIKFVRYSLRLSYVLLVALIISAFLGWTWALIVICLIAAANFLAKIIMLLKAKKRLKEEAAEIDRAYETEIRTIQARYIRNSYKVTVIKPGEEE